MDEFADRIQGALEGIGTEEYLYSAEAETNGKYDTEEAKAQRESLPDFSKYRKGKKKSYQNLIDQSLTLADNLLRIFNKAVLLPNHSLHAPVAIAYMLMPSAMCEILPVMVCQGEKGSGKSTVGMLAAIVHGDLKGIKNAATTFAAIRNHLQKIRWIDEQYGIERNCILVWDDIKRQTFVNSPDIYNMIRSGYNRESDVIEIASKDQAGENRTFRCFCPKVTSTIEAFWSEAKFSELLRRIVVIQCKPWEKFTPDEQREALEAVHLDSLNIKQKLNLRAYDWDGFEHYFNDFWRDDKLDEFAETQSSLLLGEYSIPDSITGEQWEVSVDLITTGVVTGVWDCIPEAIAHMAKYWLWFNESIGAGHGATHKVLKEWLTDKTATANAVNEKAGKTVIHIRVNPKELKEYLKFANDNGWTDSAIRPTDIKYIMQDLGWRQEMFPGEGMWWIPSNG
jgi:hypothetical protein